MIFAAIMIAVALLLSGHMLFIWWRLLDEPKEESRYDLASGYWTDGTEGEEQ